MRKIYSTGQAKFTDGSSRLKTTLGKVRKWKKKKKKVSTKKLKR